MWITVNNEAWNLDNAEGIVVEDNRVIVVYPNHNEIFAAKNGIDAESVLCDIDVAINNGQKVFSALPDHLHAREEKGLYRRFG